MFTCICPYSCIWEYVCFACACMYTSVHIHMYICASALVHPCHFSSLQHLSEPYLLNGLWLSSLFLLSASRAPGENKFMVIYSGNKSRILQHASPTCTHPISCNSLLPPRYHRSFLLGSISLKPCSPKVLCSIPISAMRFP